LVTENLPVPDPSLLTTAQLVRELGGLRELLETRLDGMDKAASLLDASVNRTPTVIQTAIANVREVYDERFNSVRQQFAERDVRTEQAATASASALAAALQAAKEAVFEQAQAAAKAAEKTELSFTKQIDQIGTQISTVAEGFNNRITELKERIDRGGGEEQGKTQADTQTHQIRTDQRADRGLNVAIMAVVLSSLFSTGVIVVAILLHH
jgi:hypothetical protein